MIYLFIILNIFITTIISFLVK